MNILYEEQITVTGIYGWKALGIGLVMLLLLIASFLLVALFYNTFWSNEFVIEIIGIAMVLIFGLFGGNLVRDECIYLEGYKTEYKILMDDSFDMTVKEFYETYDVEEVEGSIWTIRTKEMAENEREVKE